MSKCFLLIGLVSILFAFQGTGNVSGQITNSRTTKKQSNPKYKVAGSEYTVGDAKVFLLFVCIKPKHLNREDMVMLARRIKKDFPNKEVIQVAVFTNYRSAKTFSINSESKNYERNMKAFKGGYYLNRITGEEYVTFSAVNKETFDREKIDFSENN